MTYDGFLMNKYTFTHAYIHIYLGARPVVMTYDGDCLMYVNMYIYLLTYW